jgi:hypothetical protein
MSRDASHALHDWTPTGPLPWRQWDLGYYLLEGGVVGGLSWIIMINLMMLAQKAVIGTCSSEAFYDLLMQPGVHYMWLESEAGVPSWDVPTAGQ